MSVYINMEMPESCGNCKIRYEMFCPVLHRFIADDGRRHNCPLIEVPEPHGRLGDLDALIADLKRQCKEVFRIDAVSPDDFWIERNEAYNERFWKTWCESFYKYLESKPTIIPASEEG